MGDRLCDVRQRSLLLLQWAKGLGPRATSFTFLELLRWLLSLCRLSTYVVGRSFALLADCEQCGFEK